MPSVIETTTIDNQLYWHYVQPRQYKFTPLSDMTPVKAAWCALAFSTITIDNVLLDELHFWDLIKRHFTEVSQDVAFTQA